MVVLFCRPGYPIPGTDENQTGEYWDQEGVLRSRLQYQYGNSRNVRVINAGHNKESHKAALETLADLLRTGACRLVLVTSLDRFGRGLEVFKVLELAEQSKTRVIAVDDGVSTAETDWRLLAMFASMKLGFSPADIE